MNWAFWSELLLRSSLLLAAGELLCRFSKNQSAAFRHALLIIVFSLVALLPLSVALLPVIHLPLERPADAHRALVTIQETSTARSPLGRNINWALWFWLVGVMVALIPLFIGAVKAWQIARRATPFNSALIPINHAHVALSTELSVPLTCGLLRPRILLPAAATKWPGSRLQAVLAHERAHVRRRDVAAQILVHLVAALWWFQPLVWILRRQLRQESELACDAEALKSGLLPSCYAAELLAVAKGISPDYNFSSVGISMISPGDLENRLRSILNPPSALLRPKRTYALVFAAAVLTMAASALTISPDRSSNLPGGSTMKRTLLSVLLTSVTLSAATVSGTVSDATGAPLSDVKVVVYNPDSGAKQEAVTSADGKFTVAGSAAGQYILRMEKPGFTSLFREFDMKADSTIAREYTMTTEGSQPVADKVDAGDPEQQGKLIRIGGNVARANLITQVTPVYPQAAKDARIQGAVKIAATISTDGVPSELRVVSSPSDDLSQSALEAVRQWRYRPTLLNGNPVAIATSISVNYTLAP